MRWIWGALVLIFIIIVWYGAGQVRLSERFIWVSCLPGKVWEVKESELTRYAPPREGEPRTIVYLACGYRKQEDGIGMSDYPESFFYAKRGQWLGRESITIYPHSKVWQELKAEKLPYLLTQLVVWELASARGVERETAWATGARVAREEQSIVSIGTRRGWR